MGSILGTSCSPNNLWQALVWCYSYIPSHEKLHMVGISAICWAIWRTRNKVTFEDHKMRTPCEIIFLASSFLMYWAGLHKDADMKTLQMGAAKMKEVAKNLVRMQLPRDGAMVLYAGATGSGA